MKYVQNSHVFQIIALMALFGQNNAQTPKMTADRIEIVESNECKVRFDYVKYIEKDGTATKSDLSSSTQDKPIAFREEKDFSFFRSSGDTEKE